MWLRCRRADGTEAMLERRHFVARWSVLSGLVRSAWMPGTAVEETDGFFACARLMEASSALRKERTARRLALVV